MAASVQSESGHSPGSCGLRAASGPRGLRRPLPGTLPFAQTGKRRPLSTGGSRGSADRAGSQRVQQLSGRNSIKKPGTPGAHQHLRQQTPAAWRVVGPRAGRDARRGPSPLNALRAGTAAQQPTAGGAERGARLHRPTIAPGPAPPLSNQPPSCRPSPWPGRTTRRDGGAGRQAGVSGRGPAPRAPLEFRTLLALETEKNTRAAANGEVGRTRAQTRPRPGRLERRPGPAIGSRRLSLAGAASGQRPRGDWFRPGAKCNAGKAGAGTAAAGCYFWGLSAARPAFLSPRGPGRPPLPAAAACAAEYKERRARSPGAGVQPCPPVPAAPLGRWLLRRIPGNVRLP